MNHNLTLAECDAIFLETQTLLHYFPVITVKLLWNDLYKALYK